MDSLFFFLKSSLQQSPDALGTELFLPAKTDWNLFWLEHFMMDEQGFRRQISAVISVKERKDNWSLRTQYSSLYGHRLIEDDPLRVKAVVIRDKSGLFKNDLKRVACFSAREPVVCSHCHRLHEKRRGGFVLHCAPEGSSTAPFMWQFHQSKYCIIHILIKIMPYSFLSILFYSQQHLPNNLHGYPCVFFFCLPRIQSCTSKNVCAGGLRSGASFHALHISVVWGTNYLSAYLFACAVLGCTIRLCALLRHTPLRASH